MCEDYVARFASHFDDPQLNSLDYCRAAHEPLNTVGFFISRAQSLHPWVCANQTLPGLGRRKAFAFAYEILDESVRTYDEYGPAASRRQLGQARENSHRGESR
jgi:hypothetical protein